MTFSIASIFGVIGVFMIVLMYLLLTMDKVTSDMLGYSSMNALGALLVLASLSVDFNFPAFLIEVFWLGISLLGMWKALARQSKSDA